VAALFVVPNRRDPIMLKNAWYLITHVDFFDTVTSLPRLAEAPDLMATLEELFGDEAGIRPAHTATAVEVMVRMAEHLSDAVPLGRHAVGDRDQFARLLNGLNLVLAYAAQVSARLAHQVDTATGADLSALSIDEQAALTTALATASCRLEEAAGLFKEAHLAAGDSVALRARWR
jgi:hypothetical protein